MSDEKKAQINKLINKINKKYDSNTLVLGSNLTDHGTIPTPFHSVNALIKGLPRGRFLTIAGPEHVGKGAFLVQVAAYNQALDPNFTVMWSDLENSFDKSWAEHLGLDLSRTLFHGYTKEVNTMEKMLDIALDYMKSELIDMWVIDSIGAMIPKGDVYSGKEEKSLEGTNMLNLQRKLGEFYRKCNVLVSRNEKTGFKGTAVALIGQIYTNPGVNGIPTEEVKGGNAVKHWAHLRLKMRRGPKADWPEKIKIKGLDGKTRELHPGWSCHIKVDKTRLNGAESQEILLPFYHGRGFDSVLSTISAAMSLDLIVRKGPYYECPLFKEKVQGKEEVIKIFTQDSNLLAELGNLVDKTSLEKGFSKAVVEDLEEEINTDE